MVGVGFLLRLLLVFLETVVFVNVRLLLVLRVLAVCSVLDGEVVDLVLVVGVLVLDDLGDVLELILQFGDFLEELVGFFFLLLLFFCCSVDGCLLFLDGSCGDFVEDLDLVLLLGDEGEGFF